MQPRVRICPPSANHGPFTAKPSSCHVHSTLQVTPPTSPCPTLSATAEPARQHTEIIFCVECAVIKISTYYCWFSNYFLASIVDNLASIYHILRSIFGRFWIVPILKWKDICHGHETASGRVMHIPNICGLCSSCKSSVLFELLHSVNLKPKP